MLFRWLPSEILLSSLKVEIICKKSRNPDAALVCHICSALDSQISHPAVEGAANLLDFSDFAFGSKASLGKASRNRL